MMLKMDSTGMRRSARKRNKSFAQHGENSMMCPSMMVEGGGASAKGGLVRRSHYHHDTKMLFDMTQGVHKQGDLRVLALGRL